MLILFLVEDGEGSLCRKRSCQSREEWIVVHKLSSVSKSFLPLLLRSSQNPSYYKVWGRGGEILLT